MEEHPRGLGDDGEAGRSAAELVGRQPSSRSTDSTRSTGAP